MEKEKSEYVQLDFVDLCLQLDVSSSCLAGWTKAMYGIDIEKGLSTEG